MFKIFGFGRKQSTSIAKADPVADPVSVLPGNSRLHSNVQKELVRVVLKDTLRMHGIPAGWIGCEVSVSPDKSGGEDLFVQLIITKWNEALLRFAPALQQQLVLGLDRFDPAVDHSGYVVCWRFAADCECPFTQMPAPQFWTKAAEAPLVAQPVTAPAAHVPTPPPAPIQTSQPAKPKFDLPPSDLDNLPSGFAPTEPTPLR